MQCSGSLGEGSGWDLVPSPGEERQMAGLERHMAPVERQLAPRVDYKSDTKPRLKTAETVVFLPNGRLANRSSKTQALLLVKPHHFGSMRCLAVGL